MVGFGVGGWLSGWDSNALFRLFLINFICFQGFRCHLCGGWVEGYDDNSKEGRRERVEL